MASKDGVGPLNLDVVISWMNPEGSVETCMGSNCKVKALSLSFYRCKKHKNIDMEKIYLTEE